MNEHEREEFAVMKNDIKYIKKTMDEFSSKIEQFITNSDNKYARKSDVERLEKEIELHKNNSAGWIKSAIPWIFSFVSLILAIIVLMS